jgi:hypothetical protein
MFQRHLEHVNGVGRGGCVGRAGGHFARTTCQDPLFRGCSMRAGPKAHVCLPGSASPPACRGSASPPACRGSASPPACRGSASPPACRGSASPPACRGRRLDGADRQPLAPRLPGQPLHAAEPSKHAHACQSGTSCRSEKNPPLTHGDPAEAGPPGQSQPSRVHPVKQQAGAMRTRTGARPSSSSCARPVARICAYLPTGSGGGRHPQNPPDKPPALRYCPGETAEMAIRHPCAHSATSPSACPTVQQPLEVTARMAQRTCCPRIRQQHRTRPCPSDTGLRSRRCRAEWSMRRCRGCRRACS